MKNLIILLVGIIIGVAIGYLYYPQIDNIVNSAKTTQEKIKDTTDNINENIKNITSKTQNSAENIKKKIENVIK